MDGTTPKMQARLRNEEVLKRVDRFSTGNLPSLTSATVREVVMSRRSCRSFLNQPIPREILLELIEAGTYAPSGSNSQNQRFLLIDDKREIKRIGSYRYVYPYNSRTPEKELRQRNPGGFLGTAAALIFVFADSALNDPQTSGEYHLWETLEVQNCAAAIQNILLQATAEGIGTCWVSCGEHMRYSRLLSGSTWRRILSEYEIPASYKIQGCIVFGYPKRVDTNGYPMGEKRHGVVLKGVERQPVEKYLVGRKDSGLISDTDFRGVSKLKVRFYQKMISSLLKLVKRIDRRMAAIELSHCSQHTD